MTEGFSLQAVPQIGIRVSAADGLEDAVKTFDFDLSLGAGYSFN